MERVSRPPPVDYDTLAEDLAALGYAMRLELLDRLRFPHTLAEIRVPPRKVEPGGDPARAAAMQTVKAHLDKLVDAGIVQMGEEARGGKQLRSYVVSPPKLYAITEELRRLSTLHAGRGAGEDATGTLRAQGQPRPRVRGPRLTLAHGVYEGKSYALDAPSRGEAGWLIGRRAGLAVSLDYDPYVSNENSAVAERGGAWLLNDLRGKNGTALNWDPLPPGGSAPLEAGDIIGVGRSLLVFYPR